MQQVVVDVDLLVLVWYLLQHGLVKPDVLTTGIAEPNGMQFHSYYRVVSGRQCARGWLYQVVWSERGHTFNA